MLLRVLCGLMLSWAPLAAQDNIPTDAFDDLRLTAPLPTSISSGQALAISGEVLDAAVGQVLFQFTPADGEAIQFFFNAASGRFDREIFFTHDQAGDYTLAIFAGPAGQSLAFKGSFSPFAVQRGSGPLALPPAFFEGIVLEQPLPIAPAAGQVLSLRGTVTAADADPVLFSFQPTGGGDEINFFTKVTNGRFGRDVVFAPSQADDYTLRVFGGPEFAFFGQFGPYRVGAGDTATLPQDFFDGVRLDTPLATQVPAGDALSLAGTLRDVGLTQILFRFTPDDGGEPVRAFLPVADGRFDQTTVFARAQTGSYSLDVFVGLEGQALDHAGTYPDLQVTAPSGAVQIPVDFFPGLAFDAPLAAEIRTGDPVALRGNLASLSQAQVVFRFGSAGGDTVSFEMAAADGSFGRDIVFDHLQAGEYTLDVFVGPQRQALDFVGTFAPYIVQASSGPIELPPTFFDGLVLDQPLPTRLRVDRPHPLAGSATAGSRAFLLTVQKSDGAERTLAFGARPDGRFDFPLRLRPDETGPLTLTLSAEEAENRFFDRGRFAFSGHDDPAPRLEVSTLALHLLADGPGRVGLTNSGQRPLTLQTPVFEGPFQLVAFPAQLDPGETGVIRLRHLGSSPATGELTLISDDPLQPALRVALRAFPPGSFPPNLRRFTADADGRIDIALDGRGSDYILALYSAQIARLDTTARYAFALDQAPPAAKPVLAPVARADLLEARLRRQERRIATALAAHPAIAAAKPAAALDVGDRRTLIFPVFAQIPQQSVEATVQAVSARAVAYVQDDLRPDADNLPLEQLPAILERFDADYDRLVALFGAPSDVDGDGRIALLFTHLVDDVGGIGGFFQSVAVVPEAVGGTGDRIDLLYLSATQGADFYRALLVHEFQHLINFNQHVLVHRGMAEESWLNEGLSHLGEDLVSDPDTNGNLQRAAAFLEDTGAVPLAGDASFSAARRGAGYLFVRDLARRLGQGVLSRLVQSGLADRENIEAATGEPFAELLAFWAARLYAGDDEAATHPRLAFARGDLPRPAVRALAPGTPLTGSLPARGVAYIRLDGVEAAALSIQTDPQGRIGAVLLPLFDVSTAVADEAPTPHSFGLEGNYPNPFNSSTLIPFRLQTAGTARLEVYSLLGQRLAILHDGPLPAGPHRFAWDGRDDAGRPLASGPYLVRLRQGGDSAVDKLLLLR